MKMIILKYKPMKAPILLKCKSVYVSLKRIILIIFFSGIFLLMSTCTSNNQQYNYGIGIYPGSPGEDFSPVSYIDKSTYRNLALHKAAYHSSSYDYNLTAQLVTDGVKDNFLPNWTSTSTSQHGLLKKNEREWIFDHNYISTIRLDGNNVWIQIELGDISIVPEIKSLNISGSLIIDGLRAKGWKHIVSGSNDGFTWEELATEKGRDYPGEPFQRSFRRPGPNRFRVFNQEFILQVPSVHKFYRVELNAPNAENWSIGEIDLFDKNGLFEIAGSHSFTSAWKSAGNKEE